MLNNISSKIIRGIKRKTLTHDIWHYFFISKRLFKLLNLFTPFLKINDKKIVFSSFYGGNYGCNPKYITEELIKQKTNYELVWLVDKKKIKDISCFPCQLKLVNYSSIRAFIELATAKIWIDNCRKGIYPFKRKKQYYIQTWHGGLGLKKIEKDAVEKLPKQYIKRAKKDSLLTDFCISNSNHISNLFINSFWYSNNVKILKYGFPRNDILVNNTDLNHIKKKLFIDQDIKIILYAPTFRKDYSVNMYNIDYNDIINMLKDKYNCKWKFLLRLHPHLINIRYETNILEDVINVSMYPDVQELLGITDILISDYSSLMFDFMLTKKPCFIFATDYESYKEDRDVYFELNETPFPVAQNNEQLMENIASFSQEEYQQKIHGFIKRFDCVENSNASQMVVKKICELIN